jgi:AraC-like DNA-binding protein/tetratricopeptide (TPR) repeat protein
MRYAILFSFFSFFNVYGVFGQHNELDSLYTALNNHPEPDTTRANILFQICYREYTSNPEKEKVHADEALHISKAHNWTKGIGYSYRYIALYFWAIGDYEQAVVYTYEMLRSFERIGHIGGLGMSYQLLGLLNELQGDFEKAKTNYEKALEMYQKANAKKSQGYAYNSLGSLHLNSSKLDQALQYFQKSLSIREEIKDEDGLSQTYGNLAHVYMYKKDFDHAQEYFGKAIPIVQKLNNRYRLAADYTGMGEMYIANGEYGKAEHYLLESVAVARAIRHKMILEETYDKLTLLEKKRNKFESALTYFELATKYKDSLYTEGRAKKIAEIERRYEIEKKDRMIQLLERDKEIRMLWTNILIAAFILLAIASVVVYFLQRYRERKNRQILNLEIDQLTTQQKELSEKFKDVLTSSTEHAVDSMDQRLLKKVIEVVENNISDQQFGVEKMAKEMGMSRTNMHRKIKAITGFPPSELIRSIRLRKAAILLLNQVDSVSQISFQVGFEDHSYFSKSFKKQFGVPPSEYFQSKNQVRT